METSLSTDSLFCLEFVVIASSAKYYPALAIWTSQNARGWGWGKVKSGGRSRARRLYVLGKLAHDSRHANDTDAISLTVMDNNRVVTAHKDLNIVLCSSLCEPSQLVCWNVLEGKTRRFDFLGITKVLKYK